MSSVLTAILMGIIEGLTEFLPVSSTGHLIVAGEAVGFKGDKAAAFHIFIQLGAVFAVIWDYRSPLAETARGLRSDPAARRFAAALAIAFAPAAVAGLAVHDWIEANLFSARSVAGALIAGGIAILVIERLFRSRRARFDDARAIPPAIALAIGLAQVLALYPGVSRSAATILGGLVIGLSRRAATEFSFYLAIPTLGAACLYSLARIAPTLSPADMLTYGVGLVCSFVTAAIVIRLFLAWVKTRDFVPFGWYRILFGLLVLVVVGRSV